MTIVITKISNSSNLNLLDDGWPSKLWADAQIVKLGGSLIRLAVAAFMTWACPGARVHHRVRSRSVMTDAFSPCPGSAPLRSVFGLFFGCSSQ